MAIVKQGSKAKTILETSQSCRNFSLYRLAIGDGIANNLISNAMESHNVGKLDSFRHMVFFNLQ